MIALLSASAITLAILQASINAPTDAFRGCLRESSAKATNEKVAADAIETYLRNACTVQMGSLKSAVVAFRTKNGMSRKAAADDADMTVDDYLATSVDKYQFMAEMNAPKPAAQPAPSAQAPSAQAAPAAAPQPPKPEGQ
jgi:hypothetical protein